MDVICSYVAFCRDMISPSIVQSCLQREREGTASDQLSATKELKIEILKAKQNYKSELENKLAANNLGSSWVSMKTMTGLQNTGCSMVIAWILICLMLLIVFIVILILLIFARKFWN